MQNNYWVRGITLVEVMLAIAILGIGITGLVMSASRCLAVISKARNYETARRLFGEIELKDPLFSGSKKKPEVGDENGTFEDPYADFKWERRIEQFDERDDNGLFRITMSVIWSEHGQQGREDVVTYLYAP